MEKNLWLRYALYSFLGILILMAVSGLLMPSGPGYNNMTGYGYERDMMKQGMQPVGMNGMMQQGMQPMGMNGMGGGMQVNGLVIYPLPNGGVAISAASNMQMGMSQQPIMGQLPMGMGQLPMGMGQQPMGMGQQPMGMGQQPMGMGQQPMGMGNMQSGGSSGGGMGMM